MRAWLNLENKIQINKSSNEAIANILIETIFSEIEWVGSACKGTVYRNWLLFFKGKKKKKNQNNTQFCWTTSAFNLWETHETNKDCK